MSTVPKLVYFNSQGRAEPIKQIFAIGGIEYEYVGYTFDEFRERKAAGDFPYGQLPVLIVGDRVLAQSAAIGRYAAKLAGLYPTDPLEAAKVDEFVDLTGDVGGPTLKLFSMTDGPEKEEYKQNLVANVYPNYFNGLERQLGLSPSNFAVGDKLTLADIWINSSLGFLERMIGEPFTAFLSNYPRVLQIKQNVRDHPAIQAMYATA